MNQKKVHIKWAPSSSRDVEENILLRNSGSGWTAIGSFDASRKSYTDSPQKDDGTVQYALVAKDASGL